MTGVIEPTDWKAAVSVRNGKAFGVGVRLPADFADWKLAEEHEEITTLASTIFAKSSSGSWTRSDKFEVSFIVCEFKSADGVVIMADAFWTVSKLLFALAGSFKLSSACGQITFFVKKLLKT